MAQEEMQFQAEVSRLLDIVAHSLYSEKEIFLRELISNASDACDRLRYAALTQPELMGEDGSFAIRLKADPGAKTLTIADNGIGMGRQDLIDNLGTIARSGTAAFVEQLESKPEGTSLIGQFGVGFYSAFMVAKQVEVSTRKAGEAEGWRWTSDGQGAFSVAEDGEAPAHGTRIVLHLRDGDEEYLDPMRIRQIVATYSDHIAVPVILESRKEDEPDQTLNAASALWTRPKSEITEEQYKEFYHHVGHTFDEPWLRLHFKAEGVLEYTGLLFIPSTKPFDLFHPDRKTGIKLYVKRVFITDDCSELLPSYLRFLRGIVDTEDLPLNVSRELLQNNPRLAKIRSALVKRVLGELKKKAAKAPEEYATFWNTFGAVFKEGLYEDQAQRDTLIELARFRSTAGEGLVSLADYVARMKPGQDAIYTITGGDPEALAKSPQIEGFVAKGVEVLLLSDPVDDFWLTAVPDYDAKPFKSVTRGGADLDKVAKPEGEEESDTEKSEDSSPALDALIAFVKLTLKDAVKDVRPSGRLTSSPVCLVADEGDMDMHLERLLKQQNQLERSSARILEINPDHALIKALSDQVGKDGAGGVLEDAAWLLLDQALVMEGEPLPDAAAFSRRLSALVERGLVSGG
ncbi:molecular chaperone HtpG [Pelagibius litoralis]|uniref:Chaperone protein HtpG n=1 Tax=Pelagibius litoralis TaxID=374515 RepID=A0A967K9K3_9PROT|nr:molecular chaperone HtpG [Pelagibius litoralis]NIA71098.1 molecular chaperone HtpG [Pelagibius litoralis]